MLKNINPIVHLIIAVLSIPLVIYGSAYIKLVFLFYPIWLIFKKDAAAIPALIVLVSFMSNSYAIYFSIIILAIINFKTLKENKVSLFFIILIVFLPYIIYLIINKIYVKDEVAGLAINQFQLYFSLFAFFYGILVVETMNKKVLFTIVWALFICFFINFFYGYIPNLPYARNSFFLFPFAGALIISVINGFRFDNYLIYTIIGLVVIAFGVLTLDTTFTILLSILLSFSICSLYLRNKNLIIKVLTGYFIFIFSISIVAYAISEYNGVDYSEYKTLKMSDIKTVEELFNRFKMKLFEDRAPIWNGVFESIIRDKQLLIPEKVKEIEIVTKSDTILDFDFHSHNLYLEFVRLNGIILGICFSLIFTIFVVFGNRIYQLKNIDSLFIIIVSSSIGTTVIGSFSGVFVLFSNFAILNMTILGVSYATYNIHKNDKLTV